MLEPKAIRSCNRAAILLLLMFSYSTSLAQIDPRSALLNINNLTSWMRNNGIGNRSPRSLDGGMFPRGTGSVIYQDGAMWGGKAYLDSARTQPAPFNQLIRVGGVNYNTGLRPGRIIDFGANAVAADSTAPEARVYRVRRDYFEMSEAELRLDAAEVFEINLEQVTSEQMQAVRAQYERDWKEWPVAFGAPFIDRNGNGTYEPPPAFSTTFRAEDLRTSNYDEPGIAPAETTTPAEEVLWSVCNDLERAQARAFHGSEPLGLEVQTTVWAYKSTPSIHGDYYYRRVRVINKGGVARTAAGEPGAFWIHDMYMGAWVDGDLGNAGDDLAGCDTTLGLGYFYNGQSEDSEFRQFDLRPPALGYCLVQGPRVRAANQTAWFDMKKISGWKNLPLTSFAWKGTGTSFSDPPRSYEQGTLRWYRWLRGFAPVDGFDQYYPFPPGMKPGPFPYSGDPTTATGFIDGLGLQYSFAPGDRRFTLPSGPFTLAPGDTQEIVIAVVAGLGASRLASIGVMKHMAKRIRQNYPEHVVFNFSNEPEAEASAAPSYYALSPNYPNPFTSTTRFEYTLKREAHVRVSIFDVLGREVAVLEDRVMPAGEHRASWNGRDQNNRALPSGVYFYRLKAGHVAITRKLLFVR